MAARHHGNGRAAPLRRHGCLAGAAALGLGDEIAAWLVPIAWPGEITPKDHADGKTRPGHAGGDRHLRKGAIATPHTIETIETEKTHVVERNKLGRFPFPPRYSVSGFRKDPRPRLGVLSNGVTVFVSARWQGFVLCFAAPLKGAAKHKTKPGALRGDDDGGDVVGVCLTHTLPRGACSHPRGVLGGTRARTHTDRCSNSRSVKIPNGHHFSLPRAPVRQTID